MTMLLCRRCCLQGPSPAEFFTRHLQFGTFSPTLRTHSSKRSAARSIWTYAQPFFTVMRRFYRLRARLVPYIATMQRIAHDTGVQVVRPAYYEWPECSKVGGTACPCGCRVWSVRDCFTKPRCLAAHSAGLR